MDIAKENDLCVLEDACQAHGAEHNGYQSGNLSDLSAFSFFPTKNTTVGGDGGIVISNNEELIIKIQALRDHGRVNGQHIMAGLNNRLSEILAAIGRAHMKKLDEYNNHRRKIAQVYKNELNDISQIELPLEPENCKHVYHLFTIRTEKRTELKNYLKEKNIGSTIMYTERLNELEYVKKFAGNQPMQVNDSLVEKILSLPISGTMPLEKIGIVCEKIRNFYL